MDDDKITRLCEAVFDLACLAQYLLDDELICADDSRELFASILQWAKEFEASNWDGGYMEEIEIFGQIKLLSKYRNGRK